MPAIRETIRQNEIGDQSPYVLSYAQLGKSGASFGFMQGDTNVSNLARTTLRQILAANADPAVINRILAAVSKPLPNGNPLSSDDSDLANSALASDAGQPLVDAMDSKLLQVVLDGLDTCIAAGATRQVGISPMAHLYIAPWVNMSGRPTLLCTWLKGSAVFGLPVPKPPLLTEADMQAYLQSTAFFQAHPKNFTHLEECITKGAALLPTSASTKRSS